MDIVVRDNKKLRATNKKLRATNKRLREQLAEREYELGLAYLDVEDEHAAKMKAQKELEQARAELAQLQVELAKARAELAQLQVELAKARAELAQVRDKVRTEEHANARELFKRVMGEKRQVQKKHNDLLLNFKKAKMFYKRFERNVTDPFWADP